MGLKDAVLAHADQGIPALTPFTFVSARSGHQHIHSVITTEYPFGGMLTKSQYELQPEDKTLGIHRSARYLCEGTEFLLTTNI